MRILLILALLLGFSAGADLQWDDNFAWNRARIITPGQQSWSFRTSYQHSQSRFSTDGTVQNLGQPFGRAWTWAEILAGESNETARAQLDSDRRARRLSLNDLAASSDFNLQRNETTFEIAWAYGLTTRWMIGLSAPISMVDTRIQTNTTMTPSLSGAFRDLGSKGDADIRSHVQSAVQHRLTQEGYDQLQPRQQNVIVGDFSLLSQVALVQTLDWVFSLQQLVRIPSAPNGSVSDFIRLSRDDGQIDLGLTAMVDHQWRRFLFGAKLGYVAQLPDVQKMRVPVSSSDQNVELVDRSVNRDLGDLVTTSFETFYNLNSRWSVNGAYLGFFKSRDRYSGNDSAAAYWRMSDDSNQSLHLARAGFSYVVGQPTTRSGLERKWVANVNVYQPLSGRNVTDGATAAVELQAYF
jgi:hypothetical protein